jgi:hypothetical protein
VALGRPPLKECECCGCEAATVTATFRVLCDGRPMTVDYDVCFECYTRAQRNAPLIGPEVYPEGVISCVEVL